jgi:phosphatidylglycerophosphate synthase
MIDRHALDILKPATIKLARAIHARGISANQLSLTGFAIGVIAAILIALGQFWLALAAIALNRILDGLDGAVARLSAPTDRGAFLDITLDFLFYALIPLGFAFADPANDALPAAVLLTAFIGTGTSFLAYAIIAAKRGLSSTAYPSKGFYYLGGLTEGTETILCFALMCLFPQHFYIFAYIFAALCAVTTATRLLAGWRAFNP